MTTIVINGAAHIALNQPPISGEALAAFERAMQQIGRTEAAQPATGPQAVKIGEYWPGQGGIYAGIARGQDGQPDYHLILAEEAPESDFNWAAAKGHAKTVEADGHHDFALPTRFESALLYANLRDKINTDYWYWTGAEHSAGRAFFQGFGYGYQYLCTVSFEARARFVRRLAL